jgi:hypothetical protein
MPFTLLFLMYLQQGVNGCRVEGMLIVVFLLLLVESFIIESAPMPRNILIPIKSIRIVLLRCNAIYIIIFDVFFYFVYYHFLNEAEF